MTFFIAIVTEIHKKHVVCKLRRLARLPRGGLHAMARNQKAYMPCKDTTSVSPNIKLGQQIIVKARYEERDNKLILTYDPAQKTTAVKKSEYGAYILEEIH